MLSPLCPGLVGATAGSVKGRTRRWRETAMAGRLKLGQLLVAQGLVHPDQLAAALASQKEDTVRVGMALVRMGALEEEELIRVLARQLGVKVARLGGKTVSAEILDLLRLVFAKIGETWQIVHVLWQSTN